MADPRYRFGVTRDERGIESQTQEGIDEERRADKWEAEGNEEAGGDDEGNG